MSERVTMPALGESVTEGTVTRWLKNVGDSVAVDEPLLEVSTDKVDTEIPSPIAGTLQEILVGEDETVAVGADLAVIGDGAAPAGGGAGDGQATQEPQQGSSDEPGDAVSDPKNAEQVAAAGGEGGQEPAQPQASGGGQGASAQAPAEQAPAASAGGEVTGGTTVKMPALGESVTEGTVTRWLKSEGDVVAVDEPLLEVSTDKVDTEIPSPVAGTLTKILVSEDETVPVGADLAVVGGESSGGSPAQEQAPAAQEAPAPQQAPAQEQPAQQAESVQQAEESPEPRTEPPAPVEQQAPQSAPAEQQPATVTTAQAPPSGESTEAADAAAYVTPLVRKLASDNDIDLASVTGTGIGGRIRKQDILDAVEARKAAAAPAPAASAAPAAPGSAPAASAPARPAAASSDDRRGTTQKMSRLRQTIARRMVESLQTSAQLTTVVEVDITKIARLRDRTKAEFERREGTKLSFLPFFALAAVEALKAHPTVNASIDGDQVTYHGAEHLGVAVDTDKGLLVPVIKNAGDLNIAGLARAIADLADRTRNNKITPDELGGGTFTLTNTGSRGALFDTPIINQPQVAILGTGAVVKRPVVVKDGEGGETIAIRSMVYLALSYDHRLVDGADAARFLADLKARLEDGAFEV